MSRKFSVSSHSKQEWQKICDNCFNKTDFAKAIGFTYFNGKVIKLLDEIISFHNLDTYHFDKFKKNKDKRIYSIVIKICPVCQKQFSSSVGDKEERTTCSYSCSNVYFYDERYTPESNEKRKESLKIFHEENGTSRSVKDTICLYCQSVFQTNKPNKRFCDNKCASKYRWNFIPEYRKILTFKVRERVVNGQHKGWSSRSKIEPSFPEKVTLEILAELNLSLERELKVGKWFIDFSDPDRKIALEIDGKQHELPERKASDESKDAYLISEGWVVYRIKWQKLTKEFRKVLIETIQRIFIRD